MLAGSLLAKPLVGQTPSRAQPDKVSQTAPQASADTSQTDSVPAAPDIERVEATAETPVHTAPEGTPIATLRPGTPARVVGRADGWIRVQVDGWVREADVRPSTGTALTGVTAAEVHADPDRYVGQTVDWRLQLIAVQTADDLRAEMIAGQQYLLTRGPLPEAGFVYVTVTKAQAARMAALPPLEELVLRVTIRAARTRYLETPVVDLVSVVADGKKEGRP